MNEIVSEMEVGVNVPIIVKPPVPPSRLVLNDDSDDDWVLPLDFSFREDEESPRSTGCFTEKHYVRKDSVYEVAEIKYESFVHSKGTFHKKLCEKKYLCPIPSWPLHLQRDK